jgi:hypothetical protein
MIATPANKSDTKITIGVKNGSSHTKTSKTSDR